MSLISKVFLLIERAKSRYKYVEVLRSKQDLPYTIMGGKLIVWFNDSNGSTHIESTPI